MMLMMMLLTTTVMMIITRKRMVMLSLALQKASSGWVTHGRIYFRRTEMPPMLSVATDSSRMLAGGVLRRQIFVLKHIVILPCAFSGCRLRPRRRRSHRRRRRCPHGSTRRYDGLRSRGSKSTTPQEYLGVSFLRDFVTSGWCLPS